MTNREEIKNAIEWIEGLRDGWNDKDNIKYCNMAIKALEDKDTIDKIRAEIEEMTPTYHNFDWSITDLVPISKVLKLIDKYKAENEDKRTEERTETHACDCISREAEIGEVLREVETLRRDVRELKELLGYIRKYGTVKDETPRHIGQRFCEIVDGLEEEQDESE